jgi:hypothetical protein
VAEGVVGRDEEDAAHALLDHGARQPVAVSPGIVGPVHRVGRAFLAGQQRGAGARSDHHLVAVAHDLVDGERDAGIRQVDDHADALGVEPAPGDLRPDVGLVLMVAGDHLDRLSGGAAAEILHRHLGGEQRSRPLVVRIDARHVVEHADLEHALRGCGTGRERASGGGETECPQDYFHEILPMRACFSRSRRPVCPMIIHSGPAVHLSLRRSRHPRRHALSARGFRAFPGACTGRPGGSRKFVVEDNNRASSVFPRLGGRPAFDGAPRRVL